MFIKYIILIPAYEPDEKLIEVLKRIDKQFDTVVVNDGSGPSYERIFQAASQYGHIISYEENRGKGYALRTGLTYIRDHYQDYVVVTMDSDGQHRVEDAVQLCGYAQKNRNSLILGKRSLHKDAPVRSRMGNTITRNVYRFITGQNIYDTQTGLRAFSSDLTDYMLSIKGDGYEYEMNVLLHLKRGKVEVKEFPIKTIYLDHNKGSHFHTIKDSFKIYKDIILFSMSGMSGFVIDYILYAILVIFKTNINIANVLARIVSALCNYAINKKVVFKNDKKSTFIQYVFLAVIILILNTFILNMFISIGLNKYIAKVFTELSLFVVSFIVQKKIIFRKDGKNNEEIF